MSEEIRGTTTAGIVNARPWRWGAAVVRVRFRHPDRRRGGGRGRRQSSNRAGVRSLGLLGRNVVALAAIYQKSIIVGRFGVLRRGHTGYTGRRDSGRGFGVGAIHTVYVIDVPVVRRGLRGKSCPYFVVEKLQIMVHGRNGSSPRHRGRRHGRKRNEATPLRTR